MNNLISSNKKAFHNYFISDELEVGIVLTGSEVKSIRDGSFSLAESFIQIINGELFLKNAYIKPYDKASQFAPDPKKNRKLLANKKEIEKLDKKLQTQGLTLVPIKAYFKNNIVKLQIGLGKGKKLYDKREDEKEKTVNREILKIDKNLKKY